MELYHGSTKIIKSPRILEQQRLLDFGKGLYLTTSREQAELWAGIKAKRMGGGEKAVVNIYTTVNDLAAIPELKTKIFPFANEEWLLGDTNFSRNVYFV